MPTNDRPSTRRRGRAARPPLVLAALFLIAFTRPSHAYVDPGSASILITAILGGIAAVGYTARRYWERFKALLGQVKGTRKGGE